MIYTGAAEAANASTNRNETKWNDLPSTDNPASTQFEQLFI